MTTKEGFWSFQCLFANQVVTTDEKGFNSLTEGKQLCESCCAQVFLSSFIFCSTKTLWLHLLDCGLSHIIHRLSSSNLINQRCADLQRLKQEKSASKRRAHRSLEFELVSPVGFTSSTSVSTLSLPRLIIILPYREPLCCTTYRMSRKSMGALTFRVALCLFSGSFRYS